MPRLRDQQGSMLVEVMMSAVIVLVVGLGVLDMVDRTTELSGEQRAQAVAANIAQTEIDRVKALPMSKLSNLREDWPYEQESGVTYTATTRADWVNDAEMAPNCTTPEATADYLKVRTSVTYPGMGSRAPAVLSTIIAPPVRQYDASQGALAVHVTDRDGAPLAGLSVTLSGPKTLTDVTNAEGCILWGYLPAGSGYTISFSKSGYVMPDGSPGGGGAAAVVGEQTTNVNYLYDRGGSLRTNFKVKTPPTGLPIIDTKPKTVSVANGTGAGFEKTYDIGTTSSLDTLPSGLLFPFVNAYSIYADACQNAKPPTPTSGALTPGDAVQAPDTTLPALDITVSKGASSPGIPHPGATVKVVTACGTVYSRTTITGGKLADPGFPYGTNFTVCATDNIRKIVLTGRSNTSFANSGTDITLLIPTSGSTPNPTACP